MNTNLKSKIHSAIEDLLVEYGQSTDCQIIHPILAIQMTAAAELIFDSAGIDDKFQCVRI
jgi:hypothetical protein